MRLISIRRRETLNFLLLFLSSLPRMTVYDVIVQIWEFRRLSLVSPSLLLWPTEDEEAYSGILSRSSMLCFLHQNCETEQGASLGIMNKVGELPGYPIFVPRDEK